MPSFLDITKFRQGSTYENNTGQRCYLSLGRREVRWNCQHTVSCGGSLSGHLSYLLCVLKQTGLQQCPGKAASYHRVGTPNGIYQTVQRAI